MSIALVDAMLGWLVASAGTGVVHRLRDNLTQGALRKIVEEAVTATVAEVASDLDGDQREHLRSCLLVGEVVPGREQTPVSDEAELRHAVHAWAAALDEAPFGGPGYLTDVGVDPQLLASALADRVVAGIHRDARGGGALDGLAGWLWRDEATVRLARIEDKIDTAGGGGEPAGGGLPGGTPSFTGRQQALDELADRVQAHDSAGTVVAIHAVDGMAGIGKTELALRAAHQHKHRYPDGQHFLNLHGYTEGIPPMPPTAALEELLRQAGVPGQAIPAALAGRQARWQSLMATRRALVLLDNALDADQVRPLLPGSASCLVLITSRTHLSGLPDAKPLRLDVLPPAEAVELFTRLVDAAGPLDTAAVATVVDIVGRLPVAVQAVAALVDVSYTETDLADELAGVKAGIGLLERASPLGARVRAAFETSLRRLDQPHRQAFRLLGVHPGPSVGVPQFAALADLPIASARALLRGLADRNLIMASGDRVGHRRYQLHDLLRVFAREQTPSHLIVEDQAAAITRLTTWYATAMNAVVRLRNATGGDPSESGVEGLDLDRPADAHQWMAAEQNNLLAIADAAVGPPAADLCQLAAWNFYYLDYYRTGLALHRTAADIYRQSGNRAGEADALRGLGQVARITGDYPAAAAHYRAALAIFAGIGNRAGEADAWEDLGRVALATGDYLIAAQNFRAALATFAEVGKLAGQANARLGLGQVALATGDYLVAAEHFRAALATFAETGKLAGQANARLGLGQVALATGDYLVAAEHFRAALTIWAETGNRHGEAGIRRGLGQVALATGDYVVAAEHFRAALATFAEIGNRAGEANARWGLGDVANEQGRRDEAREHWEFALRIYEEVGDPSAASVRELLARLA